MKIDPRSVPGRVPCLPGETGSVQFFAPGPTIFSPAALGFQSNTNGARSRLDAWTFTRLTVTLHASESQ